MPQGEWQESVLYDKLSIVSYQESVYIAKQPSVGIAPYGANNSNTYWMLLVQTAPIQVVRLI